MPDVGLSGDWDAIKSVLGAHRSHETHITEGQITAAWEAFDRLRPTGSTQTRTSLDKGANLMEEENLLEATISVGDPFDTMRAPAVMVTEKTTTEIRADLVRQFRHGLSELVDRWSEVDDVTAFDQINGVHHSVRSLEALAATLENLAHLPDDDESPEALDA